MRRRLSILAAKWVLALALTACAPATLPPEAAPVDTPPIPTRTPAPPTPVATPLPATSQPMINLPVIDLAVKDLAARLGVPSSEVGVQSIEEVQWPDASLGCPQPGSAYAQVITPGFRVLLSHGENMYPYHTDEARAIVLCQDRPDEPPPAPGKRETPVSADPGRPDAILIYGLRAGQPPEWDYAAQVSAAARMDLAERTGLEADQVQVLAGEYTEFGLAAPCGAATGTPETGPIGDGLAVGYEVFLEAAGDQTYDYHGGGGRDPFLCEVRFPIIKDTPPKLDPDIVIPPPRD